MKTKIRHLFILLLSFSCFSQVNEVYFSAALKANLPSYIKNSNQAFAENNIEEGNRLFENLVKEKLEGTIFDNYMIKTFSSKKIDLDQIDKPILLITYASWLVINEGDIPALNKIATENFNDLQIVVFFWGSEKESKEIGKSFDKNIIVSYTDFENKENFYLVSQLKNSLGFPTSYFIDSDKRVLNICRVNAFPFKAIPAEKAFEKSYDKFMKLIEQGNSKTPTIRAN